MEAVRGLRTRAVSRALGVTAAQRRLRTTGPHVALTYDDGPDPVHTPAVLTALAEHGAGATFFVLLTRARRTPSLLAELRAAGHEIALHGPDHRPLSAFSTSETMRRLRDAQAELEDLAQTPVLRYRPPYGLLTLAAARAARAGGMRTLLWSRNLQDWTEATEAERLSAATDRVRAGDVLLAHDSHAGVADGAADGDGPDFDRGRLARAVLHRLQQSGLSSRTAEELAARTTGVRSPGSGGSPLTFR